MQLLIHWKTEEVRRITYFRSDRIYLLQSSTVKEVQNIRCLHNTLTLSNDPTYLWHNTYRGNIYFVYWIYVLFPTCTTSCVVAFWVETYFYKHLSALCKYTGFELLKYFNLHTLKILINQVEFDYRYENTGKGAAWNYISNLSVCWVANLWQFNRSVWKII